MSQRFSSKLGVQVSLCCSLSSRRVNVFTSSKMFNTLPLAIVVGVNGCKFLSIEMGLVLVVNKGKMCKIDQMAKE